jgi:hypothetical protein
MSSNLTPLDRVYDKCLKILESKKYCFIITHDHLGLAECQKTFPNAKVLELTNYQEVLEKSMTIKTDNLDIKKFHQYFSTIGDSIKFDIGSMFNKDIFFKNIQKLLLDFDVLDTTLDQRVDQFYQQYIELYE